MQRRDYKYYKVATGLVNDFDPQRRGGTLLDIGGGASMGCRYLLGVSQFDRMCIELEDQGERIEGVTSIFGNFLENLVEPHDVVLCLQTLEHVDDPVLFCKRIFETARRQVIISIPYLWPDKETSGHKHHDLTGNDLHEWTGRIPTTERVVTERHNVKRFVAEYRL